jgi:hypothetical protein
MQYPQRKLLSFVCVALFGCAVGVSGDPDQLADLAPDTAGALAFDAGANSPLIQTPQTNSPPPTSAISTPPVSPGTSSSIAPVSSSLDAAVASAPPSSATHLDASTPSLLDSGTSSSGTSNTSDAGSARQDASTTPVSAPMCNPLKCNNNCALLPRCCNEQNECACRSLFGTCSLPSL